MAKTKTLKAKNLPKPKKSDDIPATYGALQNVRAELKSDITSVKLELKSDIANVKSELKNEIAEVKSELKSDIANVKSELNSLRNEMNSKLDKMDVKFEEIKSANHRMLTLLEEQNSRNRVALDGYAAVHEAQLRLEDRVDKVEKNQFDLVKFLKSKDG